MSILIVIIFCLVLLLFNMKYIAHTQNYSNHRRAVRLEFPDEARTIDFQPDWPYHRELCRWPVGFLHPE